MCLVPHAARSYKAEYKGTGPAAMLRNDVVFSVLTPLAKSISLIVEHFKCADITHNLNCQQQSSPELSIPPTTSLL